MIRERTPLALKLYRVYVYQCSNSLGRASRILEAFLERSHESIRQWVQRLAPVCDEFDVDRRLVTAVFVDETMIRIRGRRGVMWVAFEPGLRRSWGSGSHTTNPFPTPASSSRSFVQCMGGSSHGRTRERDIGGSQMGSSGASCVWH